MKWEHRADRADATAVSELSGRTASVTMTSTRNLWLAAYLIAHGLKFVRATRLAGPHFRVSFHLEDANHDAPGLTRKFLDDHEFHRILDARRTLALALDVARERDVVQPDDIADMLGRIRVPWSAR